MFQETKLLSSKIKKLLIFQETKSCPALNKLSCVSGGNWKTLKIRNYHISFHIFCLLREKFSKISAKEKGFLYLPTFLKPSILSYPLLSHFEVLFSVLNQFIFVNLYQIFVTFTTILLLFLFFRNILISFTIFFCSFSLFS